MGTISIIIAVTIGVTCLTQVTISIVKSFLKVKNSKKIILTKNDSQKIILSSDFDKADSKRLAKFSR